MGNHFRKTLSDFLKPCLSFEGGRLFRRSRDLLLQQGQITVIIHAFTGQFIPQRGYRAFRRQENHIGYTPVITRDNLQRIGYLDPVVEMPLPQTGGLTLPQMETGGITVDVLAGIEELEYGFSFFQNQTLQTNRFFSRRPPTLIGVKSDGNVFTVMVSDPINIR